MSIIIIFYSLKKYWCLWLYTLSAWEVLNFQAISCDDYIVETKFLLHDIVNICTYVNENLAKRRSSIVLLSHDSLHYLNITSRFPTMGHVKRLPVPNWDPVVVLESTFTGVPSMYERLFTTSGGNTNKLFALGKKAFDPYSSLSHTVLGSNCKWYSKSNNNNRTEYIKSHLHWTVLLLIWGLFDRYNYSSMFSSTLSLVRVTVEGLAWDSIPCLYEVTRILLWATQYLDPIVNDIQSLIIIIGPST